MYDRGAITLQALREKVGDDTFFDILPTWYAENRTPNETTDKSVTTQDFIALTKDVVPDDVASDEDLDNFFQVWLYEEGKPESW